MSALSSLTNRIFLATALLVVAAIGVAIYRVNESVARQAEGDLRAGLAEAATLVEEFTQKQFDDFLTRSQLIAELPVLTNAAQTDDPPTVQPIAQRYHQRTNADVFAVLGRDNRVLARAGRIRLDDQALAEILTACRSSRDGTLFWPTIGGLIHVALIPMDPLRSLIVGVSLDRELAHSIKRLTNSDVAFVTGSRVVASTLDAAAEPALAAAAADPREVFSVSIAGQDFVGRVQPIGRTEDPGEPVALVLHSRTEHLRFLTPLRWQMALTGLAAVLGATLIGYLVARTVTRPLRALTGAMGEMAATGDLTRALPALGRYDDEDVRMVATTFHELTSALERFQREAALRERLSSLGRLSTVVAHEIRNPLMIIKSALRRLGRHPSPEVVEAAASIDEEVARLNRVVSGVLDFARPVDFSFAAADLATICRDAAQAVQAAGDDVPIAVEAEPATCVTDAERLRSVLVNLLANAQQAVRARGVNPPPPVLLRTSRAADGRWRIAVADRGTGIPAQHLPHIFEPFFTTRSSGSGLGLAIAKNLVEGLGGSLRVESHVGEGTTLTIDLPERVLPRVPRP